MPSTIFLNKVTSIPTDWANEVNALVFDVFGGASTAAGARNALGLGTLAMQDANAVSISGGVLNAVTIGNLTPGEGTFTRLYVTGTPLNGDSVLSSDQVTVRADSRINAVLNGLLDGLGDLMVRSATGVQALPVGTNSHMLVANSGSPFGVSWATFTQMVERNPQDTPEARGSIGDIQVRTGTEYARLPVGPDKTIMCADSSALQGAKWELIKNLLPLEDKGDILTLDTGLNLVRLPRGVDGQTLVSDSAAAQGLRWAPVVLPSLTEKGDLLTRTAAAYARLPVGLPGQVLTVDLTTDSGLKWAPQSGGGGGGAEVAAVTSIIVSDLLDGGAPAKSWYEIGQALEFEIDGTYVQNSGGTLTQMRVKKNGTVVSTALPYVDSIPVGSAPVSYVVEAVHSEGVTASSPVNIDVSYAMFWGPTEFSTTAPTTSAGIRALTNRSGDHGNNTTVNESGINIVDPAIPNLRQTLGSSAYQFVIALPKVVADTLHRKISSVRYEQFGDLEILPQFEAAYDVSVEGAAGYTATTYSVFRWVPDIAPTSTLAVKAYVTHYINMGV